MALDSNVSPKTLQSIPQVDAAKYSSPENSPQNTVCTSFDKVKQDDGVIVYAAMDKDTALKVAKFMRNLKMKNGESPRISLYDIPKFGASLIKVPEKMLDASRIIFILLTVNFQHDKNCEYLLEETLAGSRLERNRADPKKYCVRPLHTQPENSRDYKTPCGLKAICAFEVHDLQSHNGHGGERLLALFNFNRGHPETVHRHDQQEDMNKFHKVDKGNSDLAETSLVNDYTTMGPSRTSPPRRVITKGVNPLEASPGPHENIKRQGDERTLSKEASDDDFSGGSCSMEVRHGSGSLNEGEYSGIHKLLESSNQNIQNGVSFSVDTNAEYSQHPNPSDSMGSLSVDGKRSGFGDSICQTMSGNLKHSPDTEDPMDGAVDDPDETHIERKVPSGIEPDQGNNTESRDNHPKTGTDIVPEEPLVCPPSGEPAGHAVSTSNTPKPDTDISAASLTVPSESTNPGDTSASTITSVMANEVQQNNLSEPRDPKTQRCPHLGSASPFQTADSAQDMASNKDGQLLSPLVHVSDITERTDRKLDIGEISKELPDDSYRAHITHQESGIITEPVMKTSEPGHLPTAVCSSSSSEDRSLFGPQSTKGDGHDTLKTPIQEEVGKKPTSAHLQADNIPVSPNQIVPAGQSGGTPSSTTYVFINDCSHIELSGGVQLVNVNTKAEGSDVNKQHHQPKTKKKHGSLAFTSGIDETGSSGSSKSSPSSTLEMSSTDMSPKPQAASTFKVTPQSGPGKSERDAREGARCLCDVAEEDASRVPVVESRKDKISDVCSAEKGREADQADKLKLSKDERKKKSKRKTTCFPFPRWFHKKK